MASYVKVDTNETEVSKLILKAGYESLVLCGEKNVCLPERFLKIREAIYNFKVREDDVWVLTFPKSGTTWTQEMAWCIANDLDFDKAQEILETRFPFLEYEMYWREDEDDVPDYLRASVAFTANLKSPRFIKSHLPWDLLPKEIQENTVQPKIIYVTRNIKDTCVSYYYHYRILEGFRGNIDEFCQLFLADRVISTPYTGHMESFPRARKNILRLTYEGLKQDLPGMVRKTAQFLGKQLTDQQVAILSKHLTFESMQNNMACNAESSIAEVSKGKPPTTGKFMRSGKVNDYINHMPHKYIEIFNRKERELLAKLAT